MQLLKAVRGVSGFLALVFLCVPTVLANQVRNQNTGEVFPTLQQAIDDPQTQNGHRLIVNAGTYPENVVINKSLAITGQAGAESILQGLGNPNPAVLVTADGVSLENLIVQNGRFGVYVDSADHVSINRCEFRNNSFYGVYFVSSVNGRVSNTLSHHNAYHGMIANSSPGIHFENCQSYSVYYGFAAYYSDGAVVSNCQSFGNTGYGVHLQFSDNSLVTDCDIHDNFGFGIFVERSNDCRFVNCNLRNTNRGIFLRSYSSRNRIDNCNSYDQRFGLYISDFCESNTIQNSSFYNNLYGIEVWYYSFENLFFRNNIYGNSSSQVYDECQSLWDFNGEGNYWSDYTGSDANGDGIGENPYQVFPFEPFSTPDHFPFLERFGWIHGPPNAPSAPVGPQKVVVGAEANYSTSSSDDSGSAIQYGWDWNGDSIVDEWSTYRAAGESAISTHRWLQRGNFFVRVKARNARYESDWSPPLLVEAVRALLQVAHF